MRMANMGLVKQCRKICGKKNVLHRPIDLLLYEYDASMEKGRPDVIVFPENTAQIQEIVRMASGMGVPVIARGSATNLCGGTVAFSGGIIIEFSRMKNILEINVEDQLAIVEPGVYNLDLQNALAKYGYTFAPDPASQKVSTLAGNAAMNAGGPHCLKYGVTVNHVLGLEMVLPNGELLTIGGRVSTAPGYDLTGIMNGSEGTFGVITKLYLKIIPIPESLKTMLISFTEIEHAANSVSSIIARGIIPATLEYMDNLCIRTVVKSLKVDYPVDAAAVLIIEVDGPAFTLDEQVKEIESICKENGATDIRLATDDNERNTLWTGRRGALGAMTRLKPSIVVFDGTVPRNRLPEALQRIDEISKKFNLQYGTLLHAGDGNIHPIIVYDERNSEETNRVNIGCQEIMKLCVELGGTITGEHGVGREKIQAMKYLFNPEDLHAMKKLKTVFDPGNICNPGKIFP
ncbi:FAD-binding protein [candidate division KSB1 bacterium]|nr:FAD-binding protein [candidate division KSB1 bacterium]